MLHSKVKHIVPQVLEYLQDPQHPLCSNEKAEVARELIVATYEENFRKWCTPSDYLSGRHPISAHASTKCVLANWFKHNQFPHEPLSARTQATFRMGGIVETELYACALLAGADVSHWQHKLVIDRAGWPTNNFIDFVHRSPVDGRRRVVDAKTMASYSYQRAMKDGVDDGFGYLGQMSTYIDAALKEGIVDCAEGIFLCYKKDTGHIDEVVVQCDPGKVDQANAASKLVQDTTEYRDCPDHSDYEDTKEGVLPTKCETCLGLPLVDVGAADSRRPGRPSKYAPVERNNRWALCLQCTYCDYKFSCWTRPHQRVQIETSNNGIPMPQYKELPEQEITVEIEKGKPVFYVKSR